MKSDAAKTFIAELGRKYIWWDPVGDDPHSEDRIVAQAMDLGTFNDIIALEEHIGKSRLVEVMLQAEPGWFSDRSWEFWRGRLSFLTGVAIPEEPPGGSFMPQSLDPRFDVLPAAQQQIWNALAAAPRLGFVLYGGTAIALHLGHRRSIDFDFFRSEPLDKDQISTEFVSVRGAAVLQDTPNTLVILAEMPAGRVKISFFGGIGFGRVDDPLVTRDGVLLVASLEDLMATKLKVILDRAEAKDYRDIAAMISAGLSLSEGLGAFRQMFGGEPAQVLRAIGYFKDGDLPTLSQADQQLLRSARDTVGVPPDVPLKSRSLAD